MGAVARYGDAFGVGGYGTPMLGVDAAGNLAPLRTDSDNQTSTNEVHVPAANTAAVLTYAATTDIAHIITSLVFSYTGSGTLAGGNLKVEDGSDTVFSMDITTKEWGCLPIKKVGHAGRSMTITLAAGGADVTGKINASHFTISATAGGAIDFSDEMNSGILTLFF